MRAVVFFMLAVSAACAVHAAKLEQRFPVDSDPTIDVSNIAGSIRVTGWDRNEVEVRAEYNDSVDRIDIGHSDDRVRVRVVPKRNRHFSGSAAMVTLRVPRGSEIDISAVSASVETAGVVGSARLKSVSGEVRADGVGDELEIKTVSGGITVRGNEKMSESRLATISGGVRVTRGRGELEVTSISGNVEIDLDAGESLRLRTTSGSVELRGKLLADSDVDVETVSGGLEFEVDVASGFSYEVATFTGSIRNCFGATAVRTNQHGPGWRLEGNQGGEGDARLRVRSMSGGVNLCAR